MIAAATSVLRSGLWPWYRAWSLDVLAVLLAGVTAWSAATAGGSAETTLVVVNARSPLSQRIANDYLQLRGVPETHLVRLDDVPAFGTLPIADFRRKVWQPIQEYLREHALEEEIDLIAYSSDFPYGIDFQADVEATKLPRSRYRGRVASLTGLTYFARRVAAGDLGYLDVNHYFREFAGPDRWWSRPRTSFAQLSRKELRRLRKEAKSAKKSKDYVVAEQRYRQIVDSDPRVPEHWYDLACVQAAADNREQALQSLAVAVERGWANSLRTQRDKVWKTLHDDPAFQDLLARMENAYGPFVIAHGFRQHYAWSNIDLAAWKPDDALDQYYLSVMLAYTGVGGNSLPEITNYLSRAMSSDGTAPDGTVYLLENSDVRSETRQPLFPATVTQLARRGRKAEILRRRTDGQNGIIPQQRDDVIGAAVGTQRFRWEQSNSRLLPGAIAESLTSYGGHFDQPIQTKLTAFLRHGAAGSSGAVAEPFAFQEKFPVPLLHVHYADGCSLAESFYQSVQVPYQLLIVGDPLARPFAKFAAVGLRAPDPIRPWSGVVDIDVALRPAEGTALKTVELWVDGQHLASVPAGQRLSWDTRTVDDGNHELRLVAVEDSAIETRSVRRASIRVFNHDRRISIERKSFGVRYGQPFEIAGRAIGAERVELWRGHQRLASTATPDGHWRLSVPTSALGMGNVSVRLRALYPDGPGLRSDPLAIRVRAPKRIPAVTADKPGGEGLRAVVRDQQGQTRDLVIDNLKGPLKGLRKKGRKGEEIELTGFVKVEQSGFYQLAVHGDGRVKLKLHQETLLDELLSKRGGEQFLALNLEAGWHPLAICLRAGDRPPFLQIALAGQGAPVLLSAQNLGHDAVESPESASR